MMRKLLWFIPAVFSALSLTAAPVQFEVASVKPSADTPGDQVQIGIHINGSRVRCEFLNLREYVRIAYKMKDYQMVTPEWMSSTRFDISATLPEGASQDLVPEMLQTLLAERFGLKVHRESKEFAVYALLTAKGGAKLKESPLEDVQPGAGRGPVDVAGGGSGRGVAIGFGHGASFTFANNKLEAKKLTMAQLSETMARFEDKPIVDLTGLTGTYDVALDLSDEDYRGMLIRAGINSGVAMPPQARQLADAASGDSLNRAMLAVGLRMESRKAPLDVLVVDKAEKAPTAN